MSFKRPPNATQFRPLLTFDPKPAPNGPEIEVPLPAFKAPEGMNFVHPLVDTLPWMSPSLVAFVGHPGLPGDGGVQILTSYEWPIPYFNPTPPLSKDEIESLHVARFQTDSQLATGDLPFVVVGRGAEPPDFRIGTPIGERGLECTVLTDARRRRIEGLFSRIRERLAKEDRERWSKIAGSVIVAWFVEQDSLIADQLPHKASDTEALDALAEALSRLEPGQYSETNRQPSNYTEELKKMGVVSSGFGCLFYSLPMREATPTTDFFLRTGFEFACLYETLSTATSAVAELDRLVRQHDKPGVDTLLVTVSGPHRSGLIYPGEMNLAKLLIDTEIPIARPRHIRHILLHLFPIGGCYEVFPVRRWRFTPQNLGGITVAHHVQNSPHTFRATMAQIDRP